MLELFSGTPNLISDNHCNDNSSIIMAVLNALRGPPEGSWFDPLTLTNQCILCIKDISIITFAKLQIYIYIYICLDQAIAKELIVIQQSLI